MTTQSFTRRGAILAASCAATLASARGLAQTRPAKSLLDFIPEREHAAIRNGTSRYDCAPALGRAIGSTTKLRQELVIPTGTYTLVPSQTLRHADPNFEVLAAVRIVSGMSLRGELGAVLKMADGHSSNARPRAMVMFGADAPCADVAFTKLVLDMNGRRNPISPERDKGRYNRFPQAQILVSSRGGKTPARIDRALISDCQFRDSNGVSCIVMAQNDHPSASLGRGWVIDRCAFLQNGLDTDDHSSVFGYADDVSIRRSTFVNSAPYDTTGVNTHIEIHGSRHRISDCTFTNGLRGIWVANNYASPSIENVIEANSFATIFYGIDFFHDRAFAKPVRNTSITGNRFIFDDHRITSVPGLDMKAAVQVASQFGQAQIRISGNTITKKGHSMTTAFLVVTGGEHGDLRHDDIVASDNRGSGLTFGTFLRTPRTAGIGRMTFVRNHWTDLAPSSLMQVAAGDALERTIASQPVRSLVLGGGSVRAASGYEAYVHAHYINTTVSTLRPPPGFATAAVLREVEMGGAGRILSAN